MASPMFELPEHLGIGVNRAGQGPVSEDDPEFDRIACWCGKETCDKYVNDTMELPVATEAPE